MKISYAVTVCNEVLEIQELISFLLKNKRKEDEIVVLYDSKNGDIKIERFLESFYVNNCIEYHYGEFNNHFADWKNKLTKYCTGDYIFQIDADELPDNQLIIALPKIIEGNPDNEVYLVPRVNTVKGLTDEHIKKWGWRVDDKGWINWPDYQWRIWKNKKEIYWGNKVHEKLYGHSTYAPLPKSEMYAIYHPKTIEKQIKQNEFYDTLI